MKDQYDFVKNLKRIMDALDMNQLELSKRIGITQPAVSQLLNGVTDPSIHTIVKILKVIPCKFEQLVTIGEKELRK
jgi:transcriptional regulator with XRE-family HTH domain